MLPTRIRVHPVAHGGIEAKMGAKKILAKCELWFPLAGGQNIYSEYRLRFGEDLPDEEAQSSYACSHSSLATFGDAGARFDVGGNWRRAKERADGDAECINHVGHCGALEV